MVLSLGPIGRAYGLDRSVAVAVLGWPLFVLGGHLALGRPLSLSAIDGRLSHGMRVALLSVGAAALAFVLGRALSRAGGPIRRTRRVTAAIAWSAFASALSASAYVGFALGPWPLPPRVFYLALLATGAAAPALAAAAVVLALGSRA